MLIGQTLFLNQQPPGSVKDPVSIYIWRALKETSSVTSGLNTKVCIHASSKSFLTSPGTQ